MDQYKAIGFTDNRRGSRRGAARGTTDPALAALEGADSCEHAPLSVHLIMHNNAIVACM